jgi:hypothetical protein
LLALAATIGTFANPNGWRLHQHVLEYLLNSALLDQIGEFQSFNFNVEGAARIIVALLIALAGGFAALAVRRPERFLLAMLLVAGALRSARLLPIMALILLPLGNGSITSVLASARLAGRLRRPLDGFLAYGRGLRALDRKMGGLALVPLLAVALFGFLKASHAGFPPDQFPVAASTAIAALPATARIFAPDKFGGYLIYRFKGQRKVFFDGRSDFYGAGFLNRYSRMVQVRPGWNEEFAQWRFTNALLPPDYSLVPALEALGWKEIYRDGTAVLLSAGAASPKPAPNVHSPGSAALNNSETLPQPLRGVSTRLHKFEYLTACLRARLRNDFRGTRASDGRAGSSGVWRRVRRPLRFRAMTVREWVIPPPGVPKA